MRADADAPRDAGVVAHYPLVDTFGDEETVRAFTLGAVWSSWLRTEKALARAQARLGLVPEDAAAAIDALSLDEVARRANHWRDGSRTVGYPILPFLRALGASAPPTVLEYLHLGATTQDIMDTGLVLQLRSAAGRTRALIDRVGGMLARLAIEHRTAVMCGRTHAQPAVPTTFGVKCATWLDEFIRHRRRLEVALDRVSVIQLFGAGGTGAAFQGTGPELRSLVARDLGLGDTRIPWHASRDRLAELGFVLALVASSCSRIAREVTDLSRPEIGELAEGAEGEYGASSTMPQKRNPILSETIVGLGLACRASHRLLLDATQAEHERSAGEWQAEWDALPRLAIEANSALCLTAQMLAQLRVDADRMAANLGVDGGMIMAEAVMVALADRLGRDEAHRQLHHICAEARRSGVTLEEALRAEGSVLRSGIVLEEVLDPRRYLGDADDIIDGAVGAWRAGSP